MQPDKSQRPEDDSFSLNSGDSVDREAPVVAPIEALIGSKLNQYNITREIGRGSMGVVFEAEDTTNNQTIALKVLPPHISRSDKIIKRFLREAESVAKLKHPNIVKIYGIGHKDSVYYYAMELIKGRPLDEILINDGILPFNETADIILQACKAIQFAHSFSIIHRDIKPGNIIISKSGEVTLTDFGLARQEKAATLTESGALVGTPIYMSPEQVMARRGGVDKRTDIYSLGVTLYQLLTGKPPFSGESTQRILNQILEEEATPPHRRNKNAPVALSTITMKAMEKDPDQRFQSAKEMGDEIKRYLAGASIKSKPLSIITQIARRVKKHKIISGLAVISALLFIGLSTHLFISSKQRQQNEAQVQDLQTVRQYSENIEGARKLLASPGISFNIPTAINLLNECVRIQPDKFDTHILLGKAYSLQKDYHAALKEYSLAVKLAPDSWESLLARGMFLLEQGRNKTTPENDSSRDFQENAMSLGLVDLRLALKNAPDNATVAYTLAKTLYDFSAARDLNLVDDRALISMAFTHASRAQALQTNADIECLLAQIYLEFAQAATSKLEKEINLENAKKCLLRTLELNKNHSLAATLFTEVKRKLDEPEPMSPEINAREFLKEQGLGDFYTNASNMIGVVKNDIEDIWSETEKGEILEDVLTFLFTSSDRKKSKEAMAKAIAIQKERKLDYPDLLERAENYKDARDFEQAIRCYKWALVINSNEANELNFMIGDAYLNSGVTEDLGLALQHARLAYTQDSRNSAYIRLLYLALFKLKDETGIAKLQEEAKNNGVLEFNEWELVFPGQTDTKEVIH